MEFETPIDRHKVKVKENLTGGDRREMNLSIFGNLEFDIGVSENPITSQKITGEQLLKMTDKSIELVVLEVDGSKDNVLKRISDMDIRDYDFVVAKVTEITGQRSFLGEGKK